MKTERGQLTVFLGATTGVGKTHALLQAARERAVEGLRVAIGWIDVYENMESKELLQGLTLIHPMEIRHDSFIIQEMDLDAILCQEPDLVLVDDLEHVNAPGSRHNKRYLDVEELLDAGISVYTTTNIQHIESLSDVASQVTGINVEERIPDTFFDRADMVQFVDTPAEVLIKRFAQGRITTPNLTDEAASKLFRIDNINALRELALRFVALRIDMALTTGRARSGILEVFPSVERVLACVGPSPFGSRVLRAAKRLSDNLRCDLIALYVEVPGTILSSTDYEYLESNIKIAEELGVELLQKGGDDIAETILSTAAERNATQLVLGRPLHRRWKEFLRGSVVDRIISESKGIELHLIPGSRDELPKRETRSRKTYDRRQWMHYLVILALIGLITLICKAAGGVLDLTEVAMLFLLPVLYAGAFVGITPSIITAVLSVLTFDVLFVPPLYHITVDDIRHLLTFAVFFLVAISTGLLASSLRRHIAESSNAEARARTLYSLSKELTIVPTIEEFSKTLVRQIHRMFDIESVLYLPDDDSIPRLASWSVSDGETAAMESEASVPAWAFEHGQNAGAGTDTMPNAIATYYPLRTEKRVIGVLGFVAEKNSGIAPLRRQETFQAIAALATLALNKLHLALATQQVQYLEASERLWNALFDSVSHDLRTPLSSITGAATTLMDQQTELTPEQRSSLLRNIERGSAQMNRLVGKLLDMARVESGSLRIESEWCDIQDIVGVALADFPEGLEEHEITVTIQPGLPLIKVDFGLMVQVLVNLIDNAVKYSPEGSEIAVTWSLSGEEIVSSLGDRGPGIGDDEKERIFDKFSRLSTSHRVQGTGLGLSICRGIVEAHGGRIWVEDRSGGGSLFMFSLPVEKLYPEMMEEMERG